MRLMRGSIQGQAPGVAGPGESMTLMASAPGDNAPSGPDLEAGSKEGPGGLGDAVTAQGAARVIGMAAQFMEVPRGDLAFANGKMDTKRAAKWIEEAGGLLEKAEDEFVSLRYGQAVAYAEAARALAGTAGMLIAQTLGSSKLPSHQEGSGNDQALKATRQGEPPTREQVNRELVQVHEDIVGHDTQAAFRAAGGYLAEALTAYKTAYDTYRDGNYPAASDAGRLARGLLRVIDELINATQ
jgi:hypothetical protein